MLDDIVAKYNNTVHIIIKMKPIEVTDDYYAKDSSIKLYLTELRSVKLHSNKNNPKFEVGDNVRISKYKTFLLKDIL